MEDLIGIVHQLGEQWGIQHAAHDVVESGLALQVPNVPHGACREVIENGDLVSPAQQAVGKMRADESGTAGDQIMHATSSAKATRNDAVTSA